MKLSQLLDTLHYQSYGAVDIEITGIEYDSRKIRPGDLFFALGGHRADGKHFVPQALAAGASAIIANEPIPSQGAAMIVVPDPLPVMAELAARFYRHPDKKLFCIGITGTNGKTTISYLLEAIFRKQRKGTGVIGTINYRYGDTVTPAPNTTPQSLDVYRIFQEMLKARCKVAVMEVSSHALALGRVKGIEFDAGVFTNLTQDHLDFHQTMEDYFGAKLRLFENIGDGEKKYPKFAIINYDDPWGRKLLQKLPKKVAVTYGVHPKAVFSAENIHITSKETEFTLLCPAGRRKIHLAHLGLHNVYNALASAATAVNAGVELDVVVEALGHAPMVPGRLEKVDAGQPFTVVVDYAHSPDALKNVLVALRGLKPARLITVFGCGGDRDRSKRPIMGDIATELSDFVFVTSDNPRSEDPQRIALDIEVGIRRQHRDNYRVIIDREQAIAAAVHMAQKGDIVLLAGKGHEKYQIIGDQKIHFNDTEIAEKHLSPTKSAGVTRR